MLTYLVPAERRADGTYTDAPEDMQTSEVWFLNLGDPGDKELESELLRMLDVVFSGKIETSEKIRILKEQHGLRMETDLSENLEVFQTMELAIEARARDEGIQIGLDEGMQKGSDEATVRTTLKMMQNLNLPPAALFSLLNSNFDDDTERARQALIRFMQENPEHEPYIRAAEAGVRAEAPKKGRPEHKEPTR